MPWKVKKEIPRGSLMEIKNDTQFFDRIIWSNWDAKKPLYLKNPSTERFSTIPTMRTDFFVRFEYSPTMIIPRR